MDIAFLIRALSTFAYYIFNWSISFYREAKKHFDAACTIFILSPSAGGDQFPST
jgi:hypothetical protein